jgi:ribosome modulation factor
MIDFADIRDSLKILHENEGRDAALLGIDRGMCPHHFSPDKDDWERGWDSTKGGGLGYGRFNVLDYYEYDYLDLGVKS